ncbi:hypothetical protein BV210_00365 [Halorientalis sp. IM1011]|uniref:hypothetical protein n=1 Tax=Halorientalis sp. IM1011 TaxID=1932360 RepID=UPI00097CD6C9|nr:hypothetical protein [Halorientalis sp. IM1011]AQL41256.1 hypothetical protein BV210_00365 [Halorientalis sp. IM1011]
MGVRPPQQDGDEPDAIEFGIAALDARLSEAAVAFPADRDTLVEALGNRKIPYNATGNEIAIAEAIDRSGKEYFESEQELLNALHPVFEELRESASSSVLMQLKALVPF